MNLNKRKLCCKKLSKYVIAFDYKDKLLILFISSASVVETPVGITGVSFTLIFSLTTGTIKKITDHYKKQKEKAWEDSYVV